MGSIPLGLKSAGRPACRLATEWFDPVGKKPETNCRLNLIHPVQPRSIFAELRIE